MAKRNTKRAANSIQLPRVHSLADQSQSVPENFLLKLERCLAADPRLLKNFEAVFPDYMAEAEFIECLWLCALVPDSAEAIYRAAHLGLVRVRKAIAENAGVFGQASKLYAPDGISFPLSLDVSDLWHRFAELDKVMPPAETIESGIDAPREPEMSWAAPAIRHAVAIPKANGLQSLTADNIGMILRCVAEFSGKPYGMIANPAAHKGITPRFRNYVSELVQKERVRVRDFIPPEERNSNGNILTGVFSNTRQRGRQDRRQGSTRKAIKNKTEEDSQSSSKGFMVAGSTAQTARKTGRTT